MNVERFKQIVDFLLQEEKKHKIQDRLAKLLSQANNLVSQPQNPQFQTETDKALKELETAMAAFAASVNPSQTENIKAIGAYPYFSLPMVAALRQVMSQTGLTPAVLQKEIAGLANRRTAFIEILQRSQNSLAELGVGATKLSPGCAELGVKFPDTVFDKEFGELVKTLGILRRVLRMYSEAITGKDAPVEVRQISSTDPSFFLGINPIVAAEIGATITWLLNTIKQIYDIKKVRNDAAKVGLSDADLKIFDGRIRKAIDESIAERSSVLTVQYKPEGQRENIEQGIRWATSTIMAWIERGVTIEMRASKAEPSGDEKQDAINQELFARIETISHQLAFPPLDGPPVLALPKEAPPEPTKDAPPKPGKKGA
jgi:hypothetical protein